MMTKTALAAILMILAATGCGRTPAVGDASDRPSVSARSISTAQSDPRQPIDRLDIVSVQRTPGGVILRATGIAPMQGYWEGALVPVASPDLRTLAYSFRVLAPPQPTRVSTPRSREVTVAVFLTDRDLVGIDRLQVSGAREIRTLSR